MKAHSLSKRKALTKEGWGLSPHKRDDAADGEWARGCRGEEGSRQTYYDQYSVSHLSGLHTLVRASNCCFISNKEALVSVLSS